MTSPISFPSLEKAEFREFEAFEVRREKDSRYLSRIVVRFDSTASGVQSESHDREERLPKHQAIQREESSSSMFHFSTI